MVDDLLILAEAGDLPLCPPAPGTGGSRTSPPSPAPTRGRARTTYTIRKGARGVRLAESREGVEKKFYVTRQDYDAAVEALARTAADGASFDEIHQSFLEQGGSETTSGYPLRVVIRFLRSRTPPLVEGLRRNYRITCPPREFRYLAEQAWEAVD